MDLKEKDWVELPASIWIVLSNRIMFTIDAYRLFETASRTCWWDLYRKSGAGTSIQALELLIIDVLLKKIDDSIDG